MIYEIKWQPKAVRQLLRFPEDAQGRINRAVRDLSDSDQWRNVIRLTDHEYDYRLRVGNYRVLFNTSQRVRILSVEKVAKRDEKTY